MSLDAVQVNKRIGLGQSSFGSKKIGSNTNTKTTGLSAQATKNLSGASIANKPSVFSFTQQSGYHRVYGSNAAKGRNQLNLERHRASLNAQNQGVRRSNADYTGGIIYAQGTQQQHHMSTLDKIGLGVQIGMQAFQLGAQLFGGVKNGAKIEQGMSSLGNSGSQIQMSSSAGQSAIAGMQSAQTSGAMTTAIQNAQTQKAELEGKTESLKAKAGQDTKKLQAEVKTAEKGKTDSSQNLTNAKNTVSIKTKLQQTQELALESANKTLDKATTEESNAQSELDNANSLPADDPNKTAKVSAAKAKLAKAQAQKTQAQEAVSKAEQDLDAAKKAVNDAKQAQDTAQTNYDKAEKEYKEAQTKLTDAQDAEAKLKENEHDIKELDNAITKYQAQAEQMKQKEDARLQELDKKIDKLKTKNERKEGKIDASDGMNLVERNRSKGIDNRNQEISQLVAEKQTILQGQASS